MASVGGLLSYKTVTALELIKIVQTTTEGTPVNIKKEFRKLLRKLGRLKSFQVKLAISSDVKPVVRHRRIPFQMRDAVKAQLKRLEDQDIIERVTRPTLWASDIVIMPKRNDKNVRICIDMREANRAIARKRIKCLLLKM